MVSLLSVAEARKWPLLNKTTHFAAQISEPRTSSISHVFYLNNTQEWHHRVVPVAKFSFFGRHERRQQPCLYKKLNLDHRCLIFYIQYSKTNLNKTTHTRAEPILYLCTVDSCYG